MIAHTPAPIIARDRLPALLAGLLKAHLEFVDPFGTAHEPVNLRLREYYLRHISNNALYSGEGCLTRLRMLAWGRRFIAPFCAFNAVMTGDWAAVARGGFLGFLAGACFGQFAAYLEIQRMVGPLLPQARLAPMICARMSLLASLCALYLAWTL